MLFAVELDGSIQIYADYICFLGCTDLGEITFSLNTQITAAGENNCFQSHKRLVRRREAAESTEDSWVLVKHRAPAGWDIDPCVTARLAKPLNGWLSMHVCVWVCVGERVSECSLFRLWVWEKYLRGKSSCNARYSRPFSQRVVTHIRGFSQIRQLETCWHFPDSHRRAYDE